MRPSSSINNVLNSANGYIEFICQYFNWYSISSFFSDFKNLGFFQDSRFVFSAFKISISVFLHPVSNIIQLSTNKQMRWFHTSRIVAVMKYAHPVWDWAIYDFIRDSMRLVRFAIIRNIPVSFIIKTTNPFPAGFGFFNFRPKSFINRNFISHAEHH